MARDEAYRRAEQKIEEARRSGAKKLDRSWGYGRPESEKLTELPKSLGQLAQLQSLDLSVNKLTALPGWVSELESLTHLYLRGNDLRKRSEGWGLDSQTCVLDWTLPPAQGIAG
jgi:hypothetical protein